MPAMSAGLSTQHFHSWAQSFFGHAACFTSKDLKEDEAPTSRAHGKASPGVHDHALTHVSKEEHQHCTHQKAEDHAMAEARLDLIRKNINHNLKILHERDSPGFGPEACGIQSLICTNGIRRDLAQRRVGSKA